MPSVSGPCATAAHFTPDGALAGGQLVPFDAGLAGTTLYGGSTPALPYGTIFLVSPSGSERLGYSFKGKPDGAFPDGLTVANGALYGITEFGGGLTSTGGKYGYGTVFEWAL